MSNQIEQIRTRVKTEQKLTEGLFEKGDNSYFDGQNDAYDTILRFIDYLYAGTVPTDVQEAAEITHDEGMELANDYNHYLATGLTEGWERPIGPKWMMKFAKKRFIVGAKNERERMMKDAVDGEIVKDISGKLAVTAKVNLDGFKFGDKVSVIIIKKEK